MDQLWHFLAGKVAGSSMMLKTPVQMCVSLCIELFERFCSSLIPNYPEEENETKIAFFLEKPL